MPIVVPDAVFCKECGAPLRRLWPRPHEVGYNPTLAAMLSVLPGLGHLYRGRIVAGILWFFCVAIAYQAGPIGLAIHLACAANAALSGAHPRRDRHERRRRRHSRGLGMET